MLSFQKIRGESMSAIACSCLIQTIKPERNLRKINLIEFLIDRIEQPEEALENAPNHHNVGFKFDANSIKVSEMRSLSFIQIFIIGYLKF
jgi:hypothetical protein